MSHLAEHGQFIKTLAWKTLYENAFSSDRGVWRLTVLERPQAVVLSVAVASLRPKRGLTGPQLAYHY